MLNLPDADICVAREGEQVIIDIVRFLKERKKLSDIHGIYYREKNKIQRWKPNKIIDDLNSLTFHARHIVEKYDYVDILIP